jgi:predicted ATPase/class 3 adenylate cyclase/Tfp pilus assembly protein PilF
MPMPAPSAPGLPTGTVTFLFTDIEGSTRLWEQHPTAMQQALYRHDVLLRIAIEANRGYVFKTVGDAFCAAFPTPTDALAAALSAHRALNAENWEETSPLKIRVGLHTGAAQERDGDYFGPAVNRVARLQAAGHGQQTLLSLPTYELIRDHLPAGVELRDLGERRLKDLIRPERIYQLVAVDLPSEFPPLKTLDYRPNNLPAQPTPLVGREKELDDLHRLVRRDHARLITLTGPGGIGKTRLALHAVADLLDDFQEGVWFVELGTILETNLVMSTIAQTLGVKEVGGQALIDTLKAFLKEKQLLLVLDNFEQVAKAAPQISQLLASCPQLTVLVTSRMPLRVRGEKEFPVSPLQFPDPTHSPSHDNLTRYDAVRLFVDRAIDVKPDFEITRETAPVVAEICMRLDGLPLAIELAAARIRLFPPHMLLSRLSNRLKVLTGGARDLPSRQQTLRNTIEWSYDLLDEGEKQLFRRAAVFQGGGTFEALEAVCAPKGTPYHDGQLERNVLEGIDSLVSQSLLQQRNGRDGEPRFWMLETIHEYAREKLNESEDARALQKEHALYFMLLAEEAEPYLTGPKQTEWLGRLEDEHDNLRAALRWARSEFWGVRAGDEQTWEEKQPGGEAAKVLDIWLRIAGALWRFWHTRGYLSEGREQLASALSLVGTQYQLRNAEPGEIVTEGSTLHSRYLVYAKTLNGAGYLAWRQGDYAAAGSLYEQSLAIRRKLGDKRGIALSLNNLGLLAWNQGDPEAAHTLHKESLAIRRKSGDRWGIAASLTNLGILAHEQGDYTGARLLYEEALDIQRELGDKHSMAAILNNLADAVRETGDPAVARSIHEEGLAIRRELGDKWGIGSSLLNLGEVVRELGDYASARLYLEEGLEIKRELGDKMSVAWCLEGLASVDRLQGKEGRSARLWAAAEALRETIGSPLPPNMLPFHNQELTTLRNQLGDKVFEEALAEGWAMSMEQAIEYALDERRQ